MTTHEQAHENDTWIIEHELINPRVDCWVDVQGKTTKILPRQIKEITPTTLQIEFNRPYSGKAKMRSVRTWGLSNK